MCADAGQARTVDLFSPARRLHRQRANQRAKGNLPGVFPRRLPTSQWLRRGRRCAAASGGEQSFDGH